MFRQISSTLIVSSAYPGYKFGFTEVSGDGVIGLTPEIHPGESFKYFSNVALRSGVGSMSGIYFCKNLTTNENIEIEIPKFNLVAEVLSN